MVFQNEFKTHCTTALIMHKKDANLLISVVAMLSLP